MIYDKNGRVHLTQSEFNKLRACNAQQGEVLRDTRVMTQQEYLTSLLNGTPLEILEDMIEFFEKGSSPLTRRGDAERAAAEEGAQLPQADTHIYEER